MDNFVTSKFTFITIIANNVHEKKFLKSFFVYIMTIFLQLLSTFYIFAVAKFVVIVTQFRLQPIVILRLADFLSAQSCLCLKMAFFC